MENPTTTLTKEQFNRYKVHYPSNLVIVEMPPEKELITPTGINVGFNPETMYAEGESSHVADCAPVVGVIVKQVEKLYYNPTDTARTMSWKTPLETKIGDTVWFHHLISKNCCEINVDGVIYKIIPYEDLFVAKRGDDVICLNGNVLLEEMQIDKISKFDVLDHGRDNKRGIVRFNGSDVTEFQCEESIDMPDLKAGDIVIIDQKAYLFYLERANFNSTFDHGKLYLCVQKKHIMGIL
jgi:hypothetical protein